MENRQTAVEWLEEKLKGDKIFSLDVVLKKAKKIEKEQIIDAHYRGYRKNIDSTEVSEKYYNETYGK